MVKSGKIRSANLSQRKTVIYRQDIDSLFKLPEPLHEKPEKEPGINDCYHMAEAQERFSISEKALYDIIKRNNIKKISIRMVHLCAPKSPGSNIQSYYRIMPRVTIRKRPLKGGRESIMLDYAPPLKNPKNGKPQRFEFLDLFTYEKPANRLERQHNSETNTLAENIRAQRQLEIQNRKYGFKSDKDRSGNFVEYFKAFTRSKQKSASDNIAMSYRYFVEFIGYDLTFYETDEFLITDYKNFLLSGPGISRRGTPIKRNTAVNYLCQIKEHACNAPISRR